MIRWALAQMPLWVVAFFVVGGIIGLAVGGLALTRRWMVRYEDPPNDLAGFVFAVVGVLYAVLLGMSALTAYEHFDGVERTLALEADRVGDMYRDLEGYPPLARERLQGQLRTYVHAVLDEELPGLRAGQGGTRARDAVDRLVPAWVSFEPTTPGQQALHARALDELNEFLALRRSRLQEGQSGLHGVVWFVLLCGAGFTIGFTYLFRAERHELHAVMVACLAGVIGLVVFWMVAMDYPLWGPLSVSTDTYADVREMIERLSSDGPAAGAEGPNSR